ncbi:MAG: mechanosensitive ion channel family protein [Gammaproteobacteria bacterium]
MPDKFTHFFDKFDYASLLQNAIRIAIIILAAVAIWFVIRFLISRAQARIIHRAEAKGDSAGEARRRADTITSLIRKLIGALYWVAVILTLLSQIGVNIGALVAGAGIAGLALSFGAQSLVKDYISGFFMVLENQIRVGDIAGLNGQYGTVEAINFRTTVLRGLDGTVYVFRNGEIIKLANMTRGWSGYIFQLHVAYKEDTDHVIEIIKRVGDGMKKDEAFGVNMIEDMEIHGVNELTDSAVVIRGRFKTTPMNQWSTGREFLARIKRAFDEEGINIAFPHRTLYFGETSPPFSIQRIGGDESDEGNKDKKAPENPGRPA